MINKIVVAVLIVACVSLGFIMGNVTQARAEGAPLPERFEHRYTPDILLTLTTESCKGSGHSWVATAENTPTGEKIKGCWTRGHVYQNKEVIILQFVLSDGSPLDYQLFADKFTPVFNTEDMY